MGEKKLDAGYIYCNGSARFSGETRYLMGCVLRQVQICLRLCCIRIDSLLLHSSASNLATGHWSLVAGPVKG